MNIPIDQHARCSRLRTLVADDHHLIREGVKLVLSQRSMEHLVLVVAEATCAESVLTQLASQQIDLLVLDLGMPGVTGSRWIRALRDAHPDLHIIVMTANQDTHTRDAVLATGVEAYLLKQGETQTLLDAVNTLALKRAMPAAPRAPASGDAPPPSPTAPAESLTRREQQILALIATGATGTEVARRLYISPLTVRKHRENLMRKLEVHNTAELVAYAVRLGIQ